MQLNTFFTRIYPWYPWQIATLCEGEAELGAFYSHGLVPGMLLTRHPTYLDPMERLRDLGDMGDTFLDQWIST